MKDRGSKDSKPVGKPGTTRDQAHRPEREDYWDRIARDVAGGYGAQRARRGDLLNSDQLPDDARRGDA